MQKDLHTIIAHRQKRFCDFSCSPDYSTSAEEGYSVRRRKPTLPAQPISPASPIREHVKAVEPFDDELFGKHDCYWITISPFQAGDKPAFAGIIDVEGAIRACTAELKHQFSAIFDGIVSTSRKPGKGKCRLAYAHSHIIAFLPRGTTTVRRLRAHLAARLGPKARKDAVFVAKLDSLDDVEVRRIYMAKHFLFRKISGVKGFPKGIKSHFTSRNHPSRKTSSKSQSSADIINIVNHSPG